MKEFALKYLSRKFIVFQQLNGSAFLIPLSFHAAGLGSDVILASLGVVTLSAGIYGAFNLKETKLDQAAATDEKSAA